MSTANEMNIINATIQTIAQTIAVPLRCFARRGVIFPIHNQIVPQFRSACSARKTHCRAPENYSGETVPLQIRSSTMDAGLHQIRSMVARLRLSEVYMSK